MKLILYIGPSGYPHHKNYDAIQRMCKSSSVEFEISSSIDRLQLPNYDILN